MPEVATETGPRPRYAGQRRFRICLADVENAFGVDFRIRSQAQHCFVAGALALFDQPRPNPPHHRMEPEQRLDSHVNRSEEVVPSPDVAKFMRQQRRHLRLGEPLDDARGQQQNRPPKSHHARFPRARRIPNLDGCRDIDSPAGAHRSADAAPPTEPHQQDRREPGRPDTEDRDRSPVHAAVSFGSPGHCCRKRLRDLFRRHGHHCRRRDAARRRRRQTPKVDQQPKRNQKFHRSAEPHPIPHLRPISAQP